MSDYYNFTLQTNKGAAKRVRVTNPNLSLTPAALGMAAANLVNSDIFALKEGFLAGVKKAQHITVTTEKLL